MWACLRYRPFQHLQEVWERIEEVLVPCSVWTCQAWRLNALAGMTVWGNHCGMRRSYHLSKQEPWLKAIKAFFSWSGPWACLCLGTRDVALLSFAWLAVTSFCKLAPCKKLLARGLVLDIDRSNISRKIGNNSEKSWPLYELWICLVLGINALAGMGQRLQDDKILSLFETRAVMEAFFPWSGLAYKRRLSWQEGPEDPSLLPDLLWQATDVSFGHARSCLHVGLS